ncbi:DUF6233 domain-containing protein [Streptomyces sp. NPDC002076]
MHDDSPLTRLDMLRFVRRVVEQQTTRQLTLIDRWIADEERREYERRQGEQRRPPKPKWLIQFGLNRQKCGCRSHRRLLGRGQERAVPPGAPAAGARRAAASGTSVCPLPAGHRPRHPGLASARSGAARAAARGLHSPVVGVTELG